MWYFAIFFFAFFNLSWKLSAYAGRLPATLGSRFADIVEHESLAFCHSNKKLLDLLFMINHWKMQISFLWPATNYQC